MIPNESPPGLTAEQLAIIGQASPVAETEALQPPELIPDELSEVPPPHQPQPVDMAVNIHAVDTDLAESILSELYADYRFVTGLGHLDCSRRRSMEKRVDHSAIESLVGAYASVAEYPDSLLDADEPERGHADFKEN